MTASHPTESPPLALGNGRKGASTVVAVKQSEWLEWVETVPSPTRVGAIGLLRADPGGPDLPEPTEAAQARDGPYLRLCRSRSTKNKTAIGSRGWINAALTRRYRARRVRSRCGTLRHVGFALVAAEARILLASSFVSMAMRRADGLPVPFVALGAAGADLWVGG